jgi:carbonic anhydrase
VAATVQALAEGAGPHSSNLRSIVERISPHVEHLFQDPGHSSTSLAAAVRANALASARELRHASTALQELVDRGRVVITAAVYDLETGMVTFHDEE